MPAAARKTPLKLLPAIAEGARQRALQVNQPLSTYVAILLWNYAQAPLAGLAAEPDSPHMARVHVPCSLRARLWALVAPLVTKSGLSANALIEALIAHDLRTPEAALVILPARGSAKPRL